MYEEEDEEYSDAILTPPEIRDEAQIAKNAVLPEKSKRRYEIALEVFQKWQKENKVQNLHSENVLLAYFKREATSKSPNTLGSIYSMLRSMINLKFKVDISKYTNLTALLKNNSKGYTPKKSKVFSDEHITRFLVEANDTDYLLSKVSHPIKKP